jgi:hypothetical protein
MVSRPIGPRRIRVEELARLPTFVLPTVSWSGQKLAVYWDKTGRFELYNPGSEERGYAPGEPRGGAAGYPGRLCLGPL